MASCRRACEPRRGHRDGETGEGPGAGGTLGAGGSGEEGPGETRAAGPGWVAPLLPRAPGSLPGLTGARPVLFPVSPRCPSRSTRGRYGEGAKQEKFKYALTLVFIQCVINAAFAKLRKSGIPGLPGAAVAEPGAAAEPPLSPQ